jgi:hypothetical protein
MTTPADRLVPKVDPRSRAAEPDDPYTLHATPAPGDPEVLLRCLVQEYAGMGWGGEEILELFRSPFFPALHGLLRVYGEAGVRERVAAVLRRTGTLRFRAVVREAPEAEEEEPELVQIGVLQRPRPAATPCGGGPVKGGDHAEGL